MKNAYGAYRATQVDTADQGTLILLAYDIAIKSCKQALGSFDDHNHIEERTKSLVKAQDAISELMSALRMDVGEVGQNLYRLYDYMLRRLIHANAHSDSSAVEEVRDHLTNLRNAWEDAINQVKRSADNQSTDTAGPSQNFAISG
jgi:flagellar protein FliS